MAYGAHARLEAFRIGKCLSLRRAESEAMKL